MRQAQHISQVKYRRGKTCRRKKALGVKESIREGTYMQEAEHIESFTLEKTLKIIKANH